MGRSRYRIFDEQAPHFLTCTILNWIPIFTRPQTVNIILDALHYRQENLGWIIYGDVILENHLHLIAQSQNLALELPRFKSFTARQIIDYLKEQKAERIRPIMQSGWLCLLGRRGTGCRADRPGTVDWQLPAPRSDGRQGSAPNPALPDSDFSILHKGNFLVRQFFVS